MTPFNEPARGLPKSVNNVNPILPWGGALSDTVFGDRLLLLNSFTYCIATS